MKHNKHVTVHFTECMDSIDVCIHKWTYKSGGDVTETWSKCGHAGRSEYCMAVMFYLLECLIA